MADRKPMSEVTGRVVPKPEQRDQGAAEELELGGAQGKSADNQLGGEVDFKAEFERLKKEADDRAASDKELQIQVKRLALSILTPVGTGDTGEARRTAIKNALGAIANTALPGTED